MAYSVAHAGSFAQRLEAAVGEDDPRPGAPRWVLLDLFYRSENWRELVLA